MDYSTTESAMFQTPFNLIPMDIDRTSFSPNSDLNLPNQTHRVSASGENAGIHRFPLGPDPERTDSSGDSVARQSGPVCDALNDEQWSDDLSDPS